MTKIGSAKVPVLKDLALLNQAAPVQNTWYTILDTVRKVEVSHIWFRVQTTGEDLEIRVTADGKTLEGSQTAVAGTGYWARKRGEADSLTVGTTETMANFYSRFPARSFKLEVRKTSNNGAGQLDGACHYYQW